MKIKVFMFGTMVFCTCHLMAGVVKVGSKFEVKTLRDAIEVAMPHDTIRLASETFFESNVRIDKPLVILGSEGTVIDGEEKDEILVVASDNVFVSGITVQNVGYSFLKDRAGIRVEEKSNVTIQNCKLYNTFFGIYLQKSKHIVLRNNTIIGKPGNTETYTGNAIHLWYCDSILVEGNNTKFHRDGIYFEFVNHSLIKDNVSENNIRYGLHFMFSNYDDYEGNRFINNGSGVAVMFSKWINMRRNQFINNWGASSYGLLLKEIYDGELVDNYFENNTTAIHAEGANRILIKRNVIENNGWAIKIMGSCFDNKIVENNFIGNNFNIATNSKSTSDLYEANYWDDYTGYDLDKDGYGDVPHRPVKLFAYVVERVPISIIMLRSLFIEMMNVAEYVVPSLTPEKLVDLKPAFHPYD